MKPRTPRIGRRALPRPPTMPELSRLARRGLAAIAVLAACCGRQVPTPEIPTPEQVAAAAIRAGDLYHRPHVTLVAVTDWQSVLKPCGCTVDLQKGGIERITKYVNDLRKVDDSVLVVHAGSLLADPEGTRGPRAAQMESRLQAFADALEHMKIAAAAVSSYDLEIGGEAVSRIYDQAKFPVLALQGGSRAGVRSTMARTASGVSVGLVGVDPKAPDADTARVQLVSDEVVRLRSQRVQVLIVLSNLGLRPSRKLARAVPGIDVMVVGQLDERVEPEQDLEREGETLIVHAGRHGAWFSALTLAPGANGDRTWREVSDAVPGVVEDLQVRIAAMEKTQGEIKARTTVSNQLALPFFEAQLADLHKRLTAAKAAKSRPLPAGSLAAFRSIGLAWSAATDPDVAKIVADYEEKLAEANLKAAGDVPKPEPGRAGFVGQTVCLNCHEETRAFLAVDLHQHAWAGLEAVKKTKDLDCVACHVTGFEQPGGSNLAHLGGLTDVQCEACHGPGSLHAAAPGKGEKAHLLAAPDAAVCTGCHTPQHAPRFEFAAYSKRLVVPGHGIPLAKAAKP